MYGQSCVGSPAASDGLSFPSLCPFCATKCGEVGRMLIHVCATNEVSDFLSAHPLTTICHIKYGKQRQNYEYLHYCHCGCSYQLNVHYSVDHTNCHITEATIPHDYFNVDVNPDDRERDKDMCKRIGAFIVENHFTKNFGVK